MKVRDRGDGSFGGRWAGGLWSLLVFVCGAAGVAVAGEGILEINQASVAASGGFPFVIASPGSYRLTGNVVMASPGPTAIRIDAADVYLDLNGFALIGPEPCGHALPNPGGAAGVVASQRGVSVVGGAVLDFGRVGVELSSEGRVADIRVRCGGVSGISVGAESRVERSSISLSGIGIVAGSSSLLIDNEVTRSREFGLDLGAGSAIRSNLLADNNGGNENPQLSAPGGFFELGPNRCGTGMTCSTVAAAVCGNGQIQAGESCDDFNTVNGDGCDSSCQVESGFECSGTPSVCTPTGGACGDGFVGAGETCDDANTNGGDGCSASCQVENGFQCFAQPSACMPTCGDGLIVGGEACDDANTGSNDGCNSSCQVEAGYQCDGQPSACFQP